MNFVSLDGSINTNAKFVCSCPYKFGCYSYEEMRVCQKQQYYVTYWKMKDYVKFWMNQKIQQRILLQQGDYILSVIPQGFIQALLSKNYLRVYYKKKKLITKCQNKNYTYQITFTKDYQIILKGQAEMKWDYVRLTYINCPISPFQLYNFSTRSFANCDIRVSRENNYEYCPINNIILIPSKKQDTNLICVWSVPQKKVINEINLQSHLDQFDIQMTSSGQYFVVRDYKLNTLIIFSYGKKLTLIKKISNVKLLKTNAWNIEWILDHKYFLLSSFDELRQYKISQNNNEIFDCQLQNAAIQDKQQQLNQQQKQQANKYIINSIDAYNQKIHIIMRQRGDFIDYYSILL